MDNKEKLQKEIKELNKEKDKIIKMLKDIQEKIDRKKLEITDGITNDTREYIYYVDIQKMIL